MKKSSMFCISCLLLPLKNNLGIKTCMIFQTNPGTFLPKTHFLDNLEIFRLDIGQISFNPVKKASPFLFFF